jgi:hypothetical protein
VLLSTIPAGVADPAEETLLHKAEQAFARGVAQPSDPDQARRSFLDAARCYRALHNGGAANPDLLRDLGNAEFLADRLPEAILAWRQGLDLAPGDAALRANLDYARRQVAYPQTGSVRPPPQQWTDWLAPSWLLWSFLAAYLLACLCALWWWRDRRLGRLLLGVSLFLLSGALAGLLVDWQLVQLDRIEHPLVVIRAEQVALSRGNGESYPPHPEVPSVARGMEARLLYERGEWLQIELADGKVGWVPRSAALVGR